MVGVEIFCIVLIKVMLLGDVILVGSGEDGK